jgi:hypothetical protein
LLATDGGALRRDDASSIAATLIIFSISDAADLFVFLAGWSLRLMADGGG